MVGIQATFQTVDAADLAARRISAAVPGVSDISLRGHSDDSPVLMAAVAPFATTSGILGLGGVIESEIPHRRDMPGREGTLLLRAPEEATGEIRGIIFNAGGYDFRAEQL